MIKKTTFFILALFSTASIAENICNVTIVSHRGGSGLLENSVQGARLAFQTFDSVEVDLQRLNDGAWVVHHDPLLGRSSQNSRNTPSLLATMSSSQWKGVRHKEGTSTGDPVPFVSDLLNVAHKSKPFNFEIKGLASATSLKQLDKKLKSHLGSNYHYSSMDIGILKTIRKINKSVYLGVIQAPETKSASKAVTTSPKYSKLKSKWDDKAKKWGVNIKQVEAKVMDKYATSTVDYAHNLDLISKLGNAGLHLDFQTVRSNINVLSQAKKRGLDVYTYDIDDKRKHLTFISNLKNQSRPTGVITDLKVSDWCSR
ncbi:MAG: hypothetical protein GQ547_01280 [Methylophaga sp.]|nr:hypothetical protein [Methylophaga sp.]